MEGEDTAEEASKPTDVVKPNAPKMPTGRFSQIIDQSRPSLDNQKGQTLGAFFDACALAGTSKYEERLGLGSSSFDSQTTNLARVTWLMAHNKDDSMAVLNGPNGGEAVAALGDAEAVKSAWQAALGLSANPSLQGSDEDLETTILGSNKRSVVSDRIAEIAARASDLLFVTSGPGPFTPPRGDVFAADARAQLPSQVQSLTSYEQLLAWADSDKKGANEVQSRAKQLMSTAHGPSLTGASRAAQEQLNLLKAIKTARREWSRRSDKERTTNAFQQAVANAYGAGFKTNMLSGFLTAYKPNELTDDVLRTEAEDIQSGWTFLTAQRTLNLMDARSADWVDRVLSGGGGAGPKAWPAPDHSLAAYQVGKSSSPRRVVILPKDHPVSKAVQARHM
jgi:hypothetical protein